MNKTLFIGSVVLDMIIHVDHLPKLKEDINTTNIKFSIGGCGYNASSIVRHFHLPAICSSPIGTGRFANILNDLLTAKNYHPLIKIEEEDNGCCLCLVNSSGERTFLCQHGAEYRFKKIWMKDIQKEELDYIYVCGLELEEKDGDEILDYLEEMQVPVFFAPGARIMNIPEERMRRILSLHPIIHLNEDEVTVYTGCETISHAALRLYEKSKELVIVTCGERGAYYTEGSTGKLIAGYKNKVKDTIGAGDAHAGACIAGLKMGMKVEDIVKMANKVSAKVVGVEGSELSEEEFNKISL